MTAPFRIDLADPTGFPSRRVEDWRWTDLARVLRASPPPAGPLTVAPGGPFAAFGGVEAVLANGRAADGGSHLTLAAPQGASTLRLRRVTRGEGVGAQASAALEVPPGARMLMLESVEGEGAYVSNFALTIRLGEGARLDRIVLLDEPADAISVAAAEVEAAPDSVFAQTVLTGGARLQRHETRVRHPGAGAVVRMDGVYVLGAGRHADLTTVVEHRAPDGGTRQLTKGVAAARARGVFQGRIVVAEGADRTDARMGHHALMLEDGAEIDAKPELEIYADDVSCAHGATVGALDDQALFYMRARGLPERQARALLTEAFLREPLDAVEDEAVREAAYAWLAARMEDL